MPATFDQLIADPAAKKIFLAEIGYYDLVLRTTGTLYVASEDYWTKPSETPASTHYREGLDAAPWMDRNLFGAGGRIGGPADISRGELVLNNLDGRFDGLWRCAFDGRTFSVYVIGEDSPGRPWGRARAVLVLTGQCESHVPAMDDVTLQIRDPRVALDVPLAADFYKGLGACLQFDGVNDKAVSASTFAPSGTATVEFRLRVLNDSPAIATQLVAYHASAWTAAGIDWYFQVDTNGLLQAVLLRRSGGAAVTLSHTGVDVRDGAWRHVALVIDAGLATVTLYVNAASVGTGAPQALTSAVCELGIGTLYGGGSNWTYAEVDEFRYWSTARSAAELSDNKDRTVDPAAAGLLHYWRMDEATGGTAFDAVTTGAINLTVTGATWVSTLEGGADLAGKIKPRTTGPADGVEGVLVDPQFGIRQFHNGRVRKFRGVQWGAVVKTEGADYTTDLEHGCITPLVAVSGVVTADLDAEADGGYLDVPVDIMRRLFTGYKPLTGDSLSLNGTTGYVDMTNASNCNFTSGDFTLELMVRPKSFANSPVLIGRGLNLTDGYYLQVAPDGSVKLITNQAGANQVTFTSANALRLNRWQRVSASRSGATVNLYVDGINGVLSAGVHVNPATSTRTLKVGRYDASSNYLSGAVDDVRIWNVARTAADIKDYGWQELAGNETGLIQYWKLNERSGTSATPSVAGGATGTLTGGTTWLSSEDGSVPIAAVPFDWTTARALNTNPVAHHWSESITRLDAISEVADGPGYFHAYENTGALRVGRVDVPKACRLGASALYFDGRSSTPPLATPSTTDVAAGLFTWEAWCRPDELSGTRTLVFHRKVTTAGSVYVFGAGWWIDFVNGVPTFYGSDGTTTYAATASAPVSERGWCHIAVTCEEGTKDGFQLVVNGTVAGVNTLPVTSFSAITGADMRLGCYYAGANPFVGVIDEARLWSGPRTTANITRDALQEILPAVIETGARNDAIHLVAYWRLNDGTGSAAVDSISGGAVNFAFTMSEPWCRAVDAVIYDADFTDVPTPLLAELPHALIRVGWRPCFRVMTDNEINSAATAERRAFVSEEFRWATYESAATRVAHPLTKDLDAVKAHFQTETAARSESRRLSAIYGTERRPFTVPVARQFGRLDPGDMVRLVYSRQGMTYGADFVALGVRDQPTTTEQLTTALTLWG